MISDILEGNWKQLKGKVQQKWALLTNDDLDQMAGKRDELIGRIQEKYGEERDAISKQLDDLLGKF